MIWIFYQNQPSKEEQAKKAKQEQVQKVQQVESQKPLVQNKVSDSVQVVNNQLALGSFAYSATLPSAKNEFTTIENNLIILKIANKGGYIAEATLKNFKQFSKDSNKLVKLVNNNNAALNIELQTKDNKVLNTKDLFFEPTLSKNGKNQILSMKLKAGENQFLEYKYILNDNQYMLDFDVRSQGLSTVLNTTKPADLEWNLKSYRNEKSVKFESMHTELIYEYEGGKDSYLGQAADEKTIEGLSYVAFKQNFFSSILLTNKPFKTSKVSSQNLVKDDKTDTIFTKNFKAILPLAFNNGEIDYKMNWYYGPTDFKILNAYNRNLDELISLGWGIFGWINRFIFIPLFGVLG